MRLLSVSALLATAWGLPARSPAADPPGSVVALCVGVGKSADPDRPALAADRDAVELAGVLRAAGGRPVALTSVAPGDGRSTAANVRRQLARLADAGPADTAVFHFSGNEMQYPGEDGYYLCPADGRLADRGSLVPLAEVYAALAKSAARVKLVVVDSCRPREGLKERSAKAPAAPPAGVGVVWACSGGQEALESEADGGVLTHALVVGLRGPADADADGVVSWAELTAYAAVRVPAAAAALGGPDGKPLRQTPQPVGDPGPLALPVRKG